MVDINYNNYIEDISYINNKLYPCNNIFEYDIEPTTNILNTKYHHNILVYNQGDCAINIFQLLKFFNTEKSNILRLLCVGISGIQIYKMFILKYKYNFRDFFNLNFNEFKNKLITDMNKNKIIIGSYYSPTDSHIFAVYKSGDNVLYLLDPQLCGITKLDDYNLEDTIDRKYTILCKSKNIMPDEVINMILLNSEIENPFNYKFNINKYNIKKKIKDDYNPIFNKFFHIKNIDNNDYILNNNNKILDLLYIINVINYKQKNILKTIYKNCLIDKLYVEKILLLYDRYNSKFDTNLISDFKLDIFINGDYFLQNNTVILCILNCEDKKTFFLIYKNINNKIYLIFDKYMIPYDFSIINNNKYNFSILYNSFYKIEREILINYFLLI